VLFRRLSGREGVDFSSSDARTTASFAEFSSDMGVTVDSLHCNDGLIMRIPESVVNDHCES
jgi:hypothetical protein